LATCAVSLNYALLPEHLSRNPDHIVTVRTT
jgi:hypothetical protein